MKGGVDPFSSSDIPFTQICKVCLALHQSPFHVVKLVQFHLHHVIPKLIEFHLLFPLLAFVLDLWFPLSFHKNNIFSYNYFPCLRIVRPIHFWNIIISYNLFGNNWLQLTPLTFWNVNICHAPKGLEMS